MKCKKCPKEIREDRVTIRRLGENHTVLHNPDLIKHMKIHTKKTRK